jgi:apolipoprotein N-acyltransferase
VTGRVGTGGAIGDWIANNFYTLDAESEKGIIAATVPLDNYLADLNAGQGWYRPSCMLVAILSGDRAPTLLQSALGRVYNQFWRHQIVYYHPMTNCTSISVDTLIALGWDIPRRGPTSRLSAIAGFPWLAVGYSQLTQNASSPLAGYAPVGGVWLVTLAVALCAAALVMAVDAFATPMRTRALAFVLGGVAVAGVGSLLARIEWTAPVGAPVSVSLLQGNITQELKFDPAFRENTYRIYEELVNASRGRLIVLPESAYPEFSEDISESVLQHLLQTARARNGDVLVGMFTIEAPLPGQDEPRYYNSVISLGTQKAQLYRKRHLVPFGEIIPLEPVFGWLIRAMLAIPISSQTPGAASQPPFAVAGEKVAVDICYEDAFGGDIRPQAMDATLLINVTNDAWYGHSLAAEQHNQMAAMRALETGRPLLRATNTGITSAIDHHGREFARLPWFTRGMLEIEIIGRQGMTPYLRWGDALAVLLAVALLAVAIALARLGRAR